MTLSDLTPRETEILRLVLAGYTNRAIAAAVFISEKTVEFHLNRLYTKIGVHSRLMAGVWAMQQELDRDAAEIRTASTRSQAPRASRRPGFGD